MNILMISDVYYPRINGVSTSIATFRTAMHGLGHQTVLVAPDYPNCRKPEADIVRIPSLYLPLDPEDRIMRMRPLRRQLQALASQRFDLVHIHTPFVAHRAGTWLARQLGIPAVETYHTFFEEYFHHYLPLLPCSWTRLAARTVSRRLERGLTGLIVPSRAIEQALRRYGLRIPIRIIPTGLDLAEFTPGDRLRFCRRHGLAPDRPTLVYVGRVAHEKNIGFLLEMLDQVRRTLPRVLLVIAGEGPAREALQRRVDQLKLGPNVAFIGYLQRGQPLWDCYAAGDAFVFASRTETQGLVLLEALALGVPVISTAELGTCDVLKGCGGALVAENNAADFAAKTVSVLSDPELRLALGRHARADAARWSIEPATRNLVGYYATLLGAWQCCRCRRCRDRQLNNCGCCLKRRHSALLVVHLEPPSLAPRASIGAFSGATEPVGSVLTGPRDAKDAGTHLAIEAGPQGRAAIDQLDAIAQTPGAVVQHHQQRQPGLVQPAGLSKIDDNLARPTPLRPSAGAQKLVAEPEIEMRPDADEQDIGVRPGFRVAVHVFPL